MLNWGCKIMVGDKLSFVPKAYMLLGKNKFSHLTIILTHSPSRAGLNSPLISWIQYVRFLTF